MLAAVCESLGWEYGALWEVDRAGKTLHCVGTWHDPSLQFDRIRRDQPRDDGSRAASACRDGSGRRAGLPGFPTSPRTGIFPRARRPHRVGLHGAFALPILRGGDVLGVMEFFSRDIRQPDAALLDDDGDRGSADRSVRGPEVGGRRAGDASSTCRSTCCASPAWTALPSAQSGVDSDVLGYDDAELRASPFLDFVHPDDRAATIEAMSALTAGARVINFENRYRARDGSYRWLRVVRRAVHRPGRHLRGGARCHRSQARGRSAEGVGRESASSWSKELDVARQKAEAAAAPRASSSPT